MSGIKMVYVSSHQVRGIKTPSLIQKKLTGFFSWIYYNSTETNKINKVNLRERKTFWNLKLASLLAKKDWSLLPILDNDWAFDNVIVLKCNLKTAKQLTDTRSSSWLKTYLLLPSSFRHLPESLSYSSGVWNSKRPY